jgi:cytochrome c-type biogenesis protein CcmH/NrfG
MRVIYAVIILLLILMTSAQCKQTAEDWFNKGFALYGQGKYDDAIQAYDVAIQLKPDFAEAYSNKGNALLQQGKYDEAIGVDPNYADAYYAIGAVLEAQGKTSEANKAFAKAKELG